MKLQDQLHGILNDLSLVSTETALMLGAIVLLIAGLISKRPVLIKSIFATVIAVALYFNLQISEVGIHVSESLFSSTYILSFASLFLLFGLLMLLFPRDKHTPEFYFLILSMIVGSIFMMKANSLLIIYLSIELVSFVSYILTGFSFKKEGFEASIKYLLFGAVSSAIMLIGLGLIYGTTQTFYISEWSSILFSDLLPQLGFLFLVFGVLFKVSIFPFHIWTPATYQSAPVDAVALFSVVPKIAGFVLLQRIVLASELDFSYWLITTILGLGIATIAIGTLGALRQSNTRRMISFGSIAHSGFLLSLVVTSSNSYQDAFWWYAAVYGIMNFGAFYLIDRYEAVSVYQNQEYLQSKNETWMGGVFTLILVSLVGLPPLAGFSAKLFLFSSLWEIYLEMEATITLTYLIIAVFATVASLFFYLKIPKNIFLGGPESDAEKAPISFSFQSKIIATIFAITLLMLFFVPKLVMNLQLLLNNVHE